jgi:hypothetical protein
MKKLIPLIISGAIVLSPVMTTVPVLADTDVSATTSINDTVNTGSIESKSDTVTGNQSENSDTSSNPTLTTVVDSNGQTVKAGTLEDSSFYWFTEMIDKLQLALTFDPVKRAHLIERQVLKELAGAQELAKKGKLPEVERTLDKYNDKIIAAQDFLKQVKDPDSDEAQILIKALNDTQAQNITVLTGLLDKIPPQAAQKIALNVVRSMEKYVEKQTATSDQDQDKDKKENKKVNKKDIKKVLEKYQKSDSQLARNNNKDLEDQDDQEVQEDLEDQENLTDQEEQREKTLPVNSAKKPKTEKQRGYE